MLDAVPHVGRRATTHLGSPGLTSNHLNLASRSLGSFRGLPGEAGTGRATASSSAGVVPQGHNQVGETIPLARFRRLRSGTR